MAELKLGYIQPVGADKVVVEGKFIKGGYLVVATTADMAALLTEGQDVIVKGSLCYCQADDCFYTYTGVVGSLWVQGAYSKMQIDALLIQKQDSLPSGENNTYLHKNATTGELEWTTVQSGGTYTAGPGINISAQNVISTLLLYEEIGGASSPIVGTGAVGQMIIS